MSHGNDEKRFQKAMVKAALQIVNMERSSGFDIDKITEFIVVRKWKDVWTISRPDHLPGMIADFLGENLLCEKFTDKSNKNNVVVVVKIGSNFYQVDFRDFYEKNALCLNVTKLDKCDKEPRYEYSPSSFTDELRIENILKDFDKHKKEEEAKEDNQKVAVNNQIGNGLGMSTAEQNKNSQPQTPKPKKGHSFLDRLFGKGTGINCDDNRRNCQPDNREFFYNISYKRPFHACTNPKIYKEFQEELGKRR